VSSTPKKAVSIVWGVPKLQQLSFLGSTKQCCSMCLQVDNQFKMLLLWENTNIGWFLCEFVAKLAVVLFVTYTNLRIFWHAHNKTKSQMVNKFKKLCKHLLSQLDCKVTCLSIFNVTITNSSKNEKNRNILVHWECWWYFCDFFLKWLKYTMILRSHKCNL